MALPMMSRNNHYCIIDYLKSRSVAMGTAYVTPAWRMDFQKSPPVLKGPLLFYSCYWKSKKLCGIHIIAALALHISRSEYVEVELEFQLQLEHLPTKS